MTKQTHRFQDSLQQLVSRNSISSTQPNIDQGNRDVIDLLANWMEDLGFRTDVQALNEDGSKANLYATIGPATEGGLVFSGHADTVPCDPRRWSTDPFALTETDQGYQGLGSTDMKGFFAVLRDTFAREDLNALKRPITLVATADEESSMTGARSLLRHNISSAAKVVIGEPTGLTPIRMHKGIMMESIRVKGIGGHSSNPSLGLNAMEVMHEVISQLLALRSKLQDEFNHPGFPIAWPTMNLGCIHGGDNPNRICSHCELEFDLRSIPGMKNIEMRQRIDDLLLALSAKHGCEIQRHSLFDGVEPFEQAAEAALVHSAEKHSGNHCASVSFATEAPFFKALGLDTLVLGPGSIDQAHAINEFIPGDQIEPAVKLYGNMINDFCRT